MRLIVTDRGQHRYRLSADTGLKSVTRPSAQKGAGLSCNSIGSLFLPFVNGELKLEERSIIHVCRYKSVQCFSTGLNMCIFNHIDYY